MVESPRVETLQIPKAVSLSDADFRTLSRYIESELGIRMPPSKKALLESRLAKRLRIYGLEDYADYIDFVFSDGEGRGELINMIDAITTNKTDFFRESDHFGFLADTILPEFAETQARRGRELHIWSAGCSTGEEPYTIAMVVADYCQRAGMIPHRIVASDLSTKVLETGRAAVYEEERASVVPPDWKRRFMLRGKGDQSGFVRMKSEIRARVEFMRINFMEPNYPVPRDFDVVFCRNVIIYFERKTQETMLERIAGHMRKGGYLILGHSETLAGMRLPLESVATTVYRRM